jgi:CheY-like chemotaxis protein
MLPVTRVRNGTQPQERVMKRIESKSIDGVPNKKGGPCDSEERKSTVLHVDDDPNDMELLRAAARKADVRFVLQHVEDVDQAMAYLRGEGIYADRATFCFPSLILLDLKMPRSTGFELLAWLRAHPTFGQIKVVVLSGSELKDDMQRARDCGADHYLVKPLGFEDLVNLVKNKISALVTRNGDTSVS